MLHVIDPPECMAQCYLLEIHELLEVWGDIKAGDDIGGCDVGADEEHFHRQVLIDVLDELLGGHSLG